jgi:hypothetical protein
VCIRYRGNVSTEPLPSNDREDTHTQRQQRDLLSLLLFFLNQKSRLKKEDGYIPKLIMVLIYHLHKLLNVDKTIVFLFLIITKNTKLTCRDLRDANISIKSVDSISVLWRPRGDHPCRSPLNPALIQDTILVLSQQTFIKQEVLGRTNHLLSLIRHGPH